jgi:hypothetical protein
MRAGLLTDQIHLAHLLVDLQSANLETGFAHHEPYASAERDVMLGYIKQQKEEDERR